MAGKTLQDKRQTPFQDLYAYSVVHRFIQQNSMSSNKVTKRYFVSSDNICEK